MFQIIAAATIALLNPMSSTTLDGRQYDNIPNNGKIDPVTIHIDGSSVSLTLGKLLCSGHNTMVLACSDGSWAILKIEERAVPVRCGADGKCQHHYLLMPNSTIERP